MYNFRCDGRSGGDTIVIRDEEEILVEWVVSLLGASSSAFFVLVGTTRSSGCEVFVIIVGFVVVDVVMVAVKRFWRVLVRLVVLKTAAVRKTWDWRHLTFEYRFQSYLSIARTKDTVNENRLGSTYLLSRDVVIKYRKNDNDICGGRYFMFWRWKPQRVCVCQWGVRVFLSFSVYQLIDKEFRLQSV